MLWSGPCGKGKDVMRFELNRDDKHVPEILLYFPSSNYTEFSPPRMLIASWLSKTYMCVLYLHVQCGDYLSFGYVG